MDEDKRIKIYIEGYKEGQKEAWKDIESLISRYDGWDLKSRVESRIGTLYQEVESKREELKEDPEMISFEEKETERGEIPKRDLPWYSGDAYLFIENRPKEALAVLSEVIRSGIPIIFIVRESPDKVLSELEDTSSLVEGSKFVWLSRQHRVKEQESKVDIKRVSPGDLSGLSQIIGNFLKSNEMAVVLFSGIPFLINYNDEGKVLKLLHFIKDEIQENEGCLVTSVAGNAVDEKFLEKMKGEFDKTFPSKGSMR